MDTSIATPARTFVYGAYRIEAATTRSRDADAVFGEALLRKAIARAEQLTVPELGQLRRQFASVYHPDRVITSNTGDASDILSRFNRIIDLWIAAARKREGFPESQCGTTFDAGVSELLQLILINRKTFA